MAMRLPQMEFLNHNHVNVSDMSYKMMANYLESSTDECLEQVGCKILHLQNSKIGYQQETMLQLMNQLLSNPYIEPYRKELIQNGAKTVKNDQCLMLHDCYNEM
jgi:hypothetical protein